MPPNPRCAARYAILTSQFGRRQRDRRRILVFLGWRRYDHPTDSLCSPLVLLGLVMVTPEIVSAISLLPWFVTLGVDWGLTGFNIGQVRLIIANSLFASAVVTFIVRARMTGMNETLEEAAADLYAPPFRGSPTSRCPHSSRRHLGCAARFHPQPRQHGRLVVRLGRRLDAVAGVHLRVAEGIAAAGDRCDVHADVGPHTDRARRRGPDTPPGSGGFGQRGRRPN